MIVNCHLYKNVSCSRNDLKKLISYMKSIYEDWFFKIYERIVEIIKVSVHNSIIKALMHFWDPKYQYFTFENVDMCLTMEEYSLLTKFHWNLYKVYFHKRHEKLLIELAKLLKVSYLYKILEKVLMTWSGRLSKRYSKGERMTLDLLKKMVEYLL